MTNQTSENNKRIAKNTLLLYVRMLFMMLVSLYTSRVVLNTLGVVDFGIYNVVGGVIAMLGFLTGSLGGASSRYITYDLGKGDMAIMKRTFGNIITYRRDCWIVVCCHETADSNRTCDSSFMGISILHTIINDGCNQRAI